MQLSHILLSQRFLIWTWVLQSECNCRTLCSPRGVLSEVLDLDLGALKSATVTHCALPEGCFWRFLIWTWVFQSVQLSRTFLSQSSAVGGSCSGLGFSKECNCHTYCSPRGVLLEVLDLDLGAPKSATVTHCALPEGCCWRFLIWTWVLQSV